MMAIKALEKRKGDLCKYFLSTASLPDIGYICMVV